MRFELVTLFNIVWREYMFLHYMYRTAHSRTLSSYMCRYIYTIMIKCDVEKMQVAKENKMELFKNYDTSRN